MGYWEHTSMYLMYWDQMKPRNFLSSSPQSVHLRSSFFTWLRGNSLAYDVRADASRSEINIKFHCSCVQLDNGVHCNPILSNFGKRSGKSLHFLGICWITRNFSDTDNYIRT